MRNRVTLTLFMVLFSLLSSSLNALAIPSFAIRYKTSCVTCHMAFPRFTPVGEAFRLNGYKFVDDELYRKDELIELGDEAYKSLWPESLWPNRLASAAPISLVTIWLAEWDTNPGTDLVTGEDEADVRFIMPHEIEIVWAGALDDHISAYGDIRYVQEDFSSDEIYSWVMLKARVEFEDLLGPENLFNLQIGSVGMHTLGLFNAREEQKLGFQPYLHNSWSMPGLLTINPTSTLVAQDASIKSFEGNSFVLQPQTGIEINGFGRHWLYYLGVVNGNINNPLYSAPEDEVFFLGSGNNTKSKDLYAGYVYKFGGIDFTGSGGKGPTATSAGGEFWRDDSVLLSLFGYWGKGQISLTTWDNATNATHNQTSAQTIHVEYDDFWRLGAGLTVNYRDVSLNGGCMIGRNNNPYGALDTLFGGYSGDVAVDSTAWFVEAHYFVYPWLIPYGRFESLDLEGLPTTLLLDGEEDRDILHLGIRAQIRANIALRVEGTYYTADNNYAYGPDRNIFFILNAAF